MYEKLLTESQQDYLKIINILVNKNRVARVKEIAEERSVSMPSVTESMKKLANDNWIFYKTRGYIELTPKGKEAANYFARRSEFLINFLHDVLGATVKQAQVEACTLEHHLSEQSLKRLGLLYQFLNHCPKMDTNLMEIFNNCVKDIPNEKEYFCISNIYPHLDKNDRHILLKDLQIQQKAKIMLITSQTKIREFFLTNGLLPGIEITKLSSSDKYIIIIYKNQQIDIPKDYGNFVEVSIIE